MENNHIEKQSVRRLSAIDAYFERAKQRAINAMIDLARKYNPVTEDIDHEVVLPKLIENEKI